MVSDVGSSCRKWHTLLRSPASVGEPTPNFDTRPVRSSARAPPKKSYAVQPLCTRKQSRLPYPAPTRTRWRGPSATRTSTVTVESPGRGAESASTTFTDRNTPMPYRSRWLWYTRGFHGRSEEHTSELQSPYDLVCRLRRDKEKEGAHLTN